MILIAQPAGLTTVTSAEGRYVRYLSLNVAYQCHFGDAVAQQYGVSLASETFTFSCWRPALLFKTTPSIMLPPNNLPLIMAANSLR